MFSELHTLLENATFQGIRLEIITKEGVRFTGVAAYKNEVYDDLAWDFEDIEGWEYDGLFLKDIDRIRPVGALEWAWVASRQLVDVRELELV
ncbi:MAG: hypothetical protein FWG65_09555 [Turicibacter sp.]|nr:hypothetical protein [Turicibacter sp.]